VATRTLRKELRRPDEFVTLTTRAVQYAQTHTRTVAWAAALLVALILGGLALASFRSAQWQQANAGLARAMALFNENKLPEAAKAFDDIVQQGSAPEIFADIARIYSAQVALRQGEFARAAAGFDAAAGGAGGFLAQRALVNQAYALEGNQQFGDAARHFAQAAAAGGPYSAVALLGEARSWERSGDAAKAKLGYEKYLKEFPEGPEKALAEARLAALP
jgi:hypothetical protein